MGLSISVTKGKKHKKKKSNKTKPNGDLGKPNGSKVSDELENEEPDGEEQDSKTPTESPGSPQRGEIDYGQPTTNGISRGVEYAPEKSAEAFLGEQGIATEESRTVRDVLRGQITAPAAKDTDARLEALVNERAALREEVAQVRRSLEEIQGKYQDEMGVLRKQLAGTQAEKDQAETQYRNLLGKVNTIRSQLGERLKADAVGLRLLPPLSRSWYDRKTYRRREAE